MYCIRMKCHNFDPGGNTSLLHVLVALTVSILRFSKVHCSTSSTDTSDESWQLRQEFPETRRALNRYMDSAVNSVLTDSSSEMNYGQTNHKKDEVVWLKPDEYTKQSEQHAIKSLSALIKKWRKLLNKPGTNNLAADTPLPKNEFIYKSGRTKSFRDDWNLGGRDEKLGSLIRKKPSSIHEGDIKKQNNLSWSHQSGRSLVNVGSNEHKHLVKRGADPNAPVNVTGNLNSSTKSLPSTKPQVDPEASVLTTPSRGDEQTSTGTPPPPQSTSTSQSSTLAQTTTLKPTTPSPSIASTAQEHLTTQKPTTPSPSISTTTQQHLTTPPQRTSSQRASSTAQQQPKPTTSEKETVQSHTSHSEETAESPTTDTAIEEIDAACDGAQCYASRLPYHWTTDATWALASMVFLMSILTFFVLYTGLWKKRNPMGSALESGQPPNPNTRINIAELLKTRLAMIPRHLRSKRQVHRKRMNGRRYEELPLHQSNGTCNGEELDYFEDEEEDDLYLRDEHTV